jgi:hypothetical protein
MKKLIKKNSWLIIGAVIGSIAGFMYWKFVGCKSGTCYIQSNPFRMTIYGTIMGALLLSIFQPKAQEK